MARIISIVNQKGGTGKSACTANLAVGLAQKNINCHKTYDLECELNRLNYINVLLKS